VWFFNDRFIFYLPFHYGLCFPVLVLIRVLPCPLGALAFFSFILCFLSFMYTSGHKQRLSAWGSDTGFHIFYAETSTYRSTITISYFDSSSLCFFCLLSQRQNSVLAHVERSAYTPNLSIYSAQLNKAHLSLLLLSHSTCEISYLPNLWNHKFYFLFNEV